MASDALNAILDGMDEDMLNNYVEYASECVEPWASFKGNHGQLAIIAKHILPAATQHAEKARPDWPQSASPEDYLDEIYGCYDSGVIADAFSETIDEIHSNLSEYWEYASGVQDAHASLAGSENAGPHSTHAVWRG